MVGVQLLKEHTVFLFTTTFNMTMNPVQSHLAVLRPLYPLKKEHAGDQSPPPSINMQYICQSQLFVFRFSQDIIHHPVFI
jgi:hypothetical protein